MPVVGRAAAAVKSIENRGLNRYRRARDQQLKRKRAKRNRKTSEFLGCFRSRLSNRVVYWCQDIRDSNIFQAFIIGVIFAAALLVGIQTYDLSGDVATVVQYADDTVLWVFVGELVVKFAGEGRFPWRFFNSVWNVFDFVIVVVGFVPFSGGQAVMALRLVRLLRVLKLVRALPKLRVLVIGLLKSLSSIVYIGALLLLLFYLYAVVGVSVFGKADPVYMGTLHSALITLFRASTLEDWTDLLYTHQFGCDVIGYDGIESRCTDPQAFGVTSVIFWVTFVVLSSMIILNLFIGVITSSMQDAKSDVVGEAEDAAAEEEDDDEDEAIEAKLSDLSELMARITDEVEAFAHLEKQRKASSLASPVIKSSVAASEAVDKHGAHPGPKDSIAHDEASRMPATGAQRAAQASSSHARAQPRRSPMGEALGNGRLGVAAARHAPFRSSPLASSSPSDAKAAPKSRRG